MPPAEQGESAADRTFDAEKEVADTPRIGRCSLERSCHRLRTRRCEARRHEKRSFERPPLWRRPRAAIVSEWLLRATKCTHTKHSCRTSSTSRHCDTHSLYLRDITVSHTATARTPHAIHNSCTHAHTHAQRGGGLLFANGIVHIISLSLPAKGKRPWCALYSTCHPAGGSRWRGAKSPCKGLEHRAAVLRAAPHCLRRWEWLCPSTWTSAHGAGCPSRP